MEGPCSDNSCDFLEPKVVARHVVVVPVAVGHCDDTNLYPQKLHMPIHPFTVSKIMPIVYKCLHLEQPGYTLNGWFTYFVNYHP